MIASDLKRVIQDDESLDLTILNDLDDLDGDDPLPFRREALRHLERIGSHTQWSVDRVRRELGCGDDHAKTRDLRMLRKCTDYLAHVASWVGLGRSVVDRRAILQLITVRYEKNQQRFTALVADLNEWHHGNELSASDYIAMGDPYLACQSYEFLIDPHLPQTVVESFVLRSDELPIPSRDAIQSHVDRCNPCRTATEDVRRRSSLLTSAHAD